MRPFILQRHKDLTGISGEGVVAQGCVLSNGQAILCWQSATPSIVIHKSVGALISVHGHKEATTIKYIPIKKDEGVQCFWLYHMKDPHGFSKVGLVGECCRFSNGWTVMKWLVEPNSIEVFPSYEGWASVHLSQSHCSVWNNLNSTHKDSLVDILLSKYRWYRKWAGGNWFYVQTPPIPHRHSVWVRKGTYLQDILAAESH